MRRTLVEKEKIRKAKEVLGDRTPYLIAEVLGLQEFDEHNLKSLCPIHREDTPSFIYNPKMMNYHCFGCGCNVDIIDAYMMTGDTYLGAVEKLFQETGTAYSFGERGVQTYRSYRYPREEPLGDRSKVDAYFATRKISKETLDHCDVRQDAHGNAVFNYYDTNDVLTMVKYRPSHKIDKSKGDIKCWCQKDADTKPLLFNMNRVNTSQPLLVSEGECLLPNAEVLTPDGWVQLGEYNGQDVLQVKEDLTAEFVKPLAYIDKWYDGNLYIVRKGRNYSSITTAGHNLVYVDYKGKLTKKAAKDMPRSLKTGYVPTTTTFDGPGINLSNDQIALYLAVSADCTIDIRQSGKRHSRFTVKKDRKFNRMKGILNRLGIEYFENKNVRKRPGYKYLGFTTPDWIESKLLPFSWVAEASLEQRKFILDEMVYWDGNRVPNRNQVEYSSKYYHNAVVMQTIAHTCGYMSTLIPRRNNYGTWIKVSILFGKNHVSWQHGFDEIAPYFGRVCCVTVPSGMILVRQEHSITITGNCDAMAAIEAGYTNTVSVPLGSQNHHWIEENMEWLDQFDEIILCADNDAPGFRMIKDVTPRLGSWRTKVVELPDVDPNTGRRIKDLNELLYYQGKQAVLDAILNAKESPINSVDDLSDVVDINISDIDGVYFGMDALDRELFKLFFGTLTLVTGRPGCVSGDTEFYNGLCWKRIDEYEPGDRVCQYNRDGTFSLVYPQEYHKQRCNMFVHLFSNDGRVDQMVSSDHDLVYIAADGNLVKENVYSFLAKYNIPVASDSKRWQEPQTFDGYFITGRMCSLGQVLKTFKPDFLQWEAVFPHKRKKRNRFKYCFTVPSGMLVLKHNGVVNVTGNSGKTSFLYQLVCNTLEQNRPAWIFSRELPDFMSKSWLNYLLAGPRNLEKHTGKCNAVYYRVRAPAKKAINDCYRGQWYIYKDGWSNDVEAIQESMEASARKHGTKLFLLDNLMMINLHSSDENKYDKQTEFINWLIQFASKFSVCVILVAHPRKFQSSSSSAAVDLYDIGGSSNLVNLAHRTLSLRRVTEAERTQGTSKFAQYSCVVSVTKDRMRGRAGFEIGMHYDDASRRFFTNYEEYDKRYRWDINQYHDRLPCPRLDEEAEVLGYIDRKEVS